MAELEEHPVAVVLIVTYSLLLCWTIVLLIWLLRTSGRPLQWRPRHTFVVLILILICVRIPNFVLILADPHNSSSTESEKTWYFWLLFNLAALLYLTIFTELILFWARMHDSMRPELMDGPGSRRRWSDGQRRMVQAIVMGVAWIGYGAAFATFFFLSFDQFMLITSYVTCAFFAVNAVFFAVYGVLLYRRVIQMPLRSAAVTSRIRRVLAVAVIMTVAFFIRALLNAILPTLMQQLLISEGAQWILFSVTWILIEAFPLFLVEVLVVMPRRPEQVDVVKETYTNHYAYNVIDSPVN